jgi:hypothetical protein
MMNEFDRERLTVLCHALRALSADARRLPMCVYRVLVALGEAGEPCGAYAVARRAGFLLEHGRVKLHEAKRLGVVASVHVNGQGVLWSLTDLGRKELSRVLAAMSPCRVRSVPGRVDAAGMAGPMLPCMEVKKGRKRKRKGDE